MAASSRYSWWNVTGLPKGRSLQKSFGTGGLSALEYDVVLESFDQNLSARLPFLLFLSGRSVRHWLNPILQSQCRSSSLLFAITCKKAPASILPFMEAFIL
jgi:hypothetical protein